MKLDKMKFARLVAHCVSNGMSAGEYEVNTLDEIIDFDVQPVVSGQIDPAALDRMLALMAQGTQKLDAIKQYRILTGQGLKDSKNAVEKYWVSNNHKDYYVPTEEPATLGDILRTVSKD